MDLASLSGGAWPPKSEEGLAPIYACLMDDGSGEKALEWFAAKGDVSL